MKCSGEYTVSLRDGSKGEDLGAEGALIFIQYLLSDKECQPLGSNKDFHVVLLTKRWVLEWERCSWLSSLRWIAVQ